MNSESNMQGETPFTGNLIPGNQPAIVLIDIVRAYFEPGAPFFLNNKDCLESAARLLAAARSAEIPVFHTRVAYTPGGADGGVFMRKVPQLECFSSDNPLGMFMPEVEPLPHEAVVLKQYASAFFGTSLASSLHARGIDTVVLAGVSTSGCVRASAVDALQNGFIPIVVRDAVGDREPGPHNASLFDVQSKYGEVLSEAECISYIEASCSIGGVGQKEIKA